MDFFQRIGNFFTGAGWVSDEEKKKKQQQQQAKQQAPRPQPATKLLQPQQPTVFSQQKDKSLDLNPKPQPLQSQKPVQQAPTIAQPKPAQQFDYGTIKQKAQGIAPTPKTNTLLEPTATSQILKPKTPTSVFSGGRSFDANEQEQKLQDQQNTKHISDVAMKYKDAPLDQLGGYSFQQYLDSYNKQRSPEEQRSLLKSLEDNIRTNQNNVSSNPALTRKYQQSVLLYNVLKQNGTKKEDFGTKLADAFDKTGQYVGALGEGVARAGQAADTLRREATGQKDYGTQLDEMHRQGKLTDEQYNKALRDYSDSLQWTKGKDDLGSRALTALGTGADAASTLAPFLSFVKGAKTAEAATKLASTTGESAAKKATEDALRNVVMREATINSALSGVGSLRNGEFNPADTLTETATGGLVGGAAPVLGNAASRLWQRLRGTQNVAPEAVEDITRATSQAGEDATKVAEAPTMTNEARQQRIDDLQKQVNVIPSDEQVRSYEFNLRKKFADDVRANPQLEQQLRSRLADNLASLKRGIDYSTQIKQELETLKTGQAENLQNAENAVTGQQQATDATVNKLQDANQATREQKVATATPAAGDAITPQGTPEVAANDAYQQFNKEAGITSGSQDTDYLTAIQQLERLAGNKTMDELTRRQAFRIPAEINAKTQGAVADTLSNTAGTAGGRLLGSQNPIANTLGQILFAFNKKSTLTNAEKSAVERLKGQTGGIGNLKSDVVTRIEQPLASLGDDGAAAAREKVYNAFETYNNGDTEQALSIIKSFTPEERAYFDNVRELNILRNNLNRSTMSRQTIDQYDNGMHMPRLFDTEAFSKEFSPEDIEAYAASQDKTLDLNPAKRRKQLEDISEELRAQMLRDPAQASAIRTEIALHNQAISDYSANIGAIPGIVSDTNQRGFLQIPEQARYGELAGKWVRRDLAEPMLSGDLRFKTDAYKAVNTLLNSYQNTIFGKLENGLRKGITTYNPGTRIGNRVANLSQGAMAGFNFPEMAVSQQHFMNVLRKGGDEWTRLAQASGAIDNNQALSRFSGDVTEPTRGLLVGARKRLSQSYADVDTAAKVAMFKWQIQRGASPEQAARFVNRALPNIGNSGEVYSFFSKLPVVGTPFRAIQPEVLRALGSTVSRNTLPFLTAMATYTTLQNLSWADVPDDERKQIQERFGSGSTPFKGLNDFFGSKGINTSAVLPSSWSFNAAGVPGLQDLFGKDPDTGERAVVDVDPRRLLGMYSINLGGTSPQDSLIDQISKASPANIPIGYDNGKVTFEPQNVVSSRLFGPLAQTIIDRDFRGKSVQNPDATNIPLVDPTTGQPLDIRDNPQRAAEYLLRSYIPQLNDLGNISDATQNKENFYGQNMDVPQSIARLFGLKGEEFTKGDLQKMNDTQRFFDDKANIDKQLEGMSPNEQQAWKRLTGYDKLNAKEPNSFGGESWKKAAIYNFSEDKWKDYASNPRLYDLMVQKKQQDAARDGSPIQPEFDERLPASFRKQLIQNKMVAPGDDAELDQRMYSSPEWDYYQKLKDNYTAAADKYYGTSDADFKDELVKNQDAKFPSKPQLYAAYTAAYGKYADGIGAKPDFTDAVKASKDEYNKATFDWTNNARKARGLPAITWDVWNNPTFGFDATPSGNGYGYGGGHGGGYGVNDLGQLTSLSNDIKAYEDIKAKDLPNIVQLFSNLRAASRGAAIKAKLGAGSSGR